jgi:type I restriction enzyme S subunit
VREGWQRRRLDDACCVEYGTRVVSKRDGGALYPVYGGGGATFAMDSSNREDRVVVGRFGMSEQCTRFVAGKFFLNDSGLTLTPKNPTTLLPAFLDRWTLSVNDEIYRLGRGTAQKNLDVDAFRFLQVPIPEPSEQHRIVSILDEAFEGIATAKINAEKNLQNSRAIFESHLQSVFTHRGDGWVERTVDEVSQHSLGKMLDKAKNKGEPKPYLRNLNVRWFTFDLSDLLEMRFMPEETAKCTATKGDVLVCEGGYPGRAAIWDEDYPIYFQKAIHRVRFHEPEHNKWFLYFFYSQDKSGDLRQHFTGTGIQHFTGEALGRYALPIPSLSELRRLVAGFDALYEETQHLESVYLQKLAALDALKKSLLHQAFTGNL